MVLIVWWYWQFAWGGADDVEEERSQIMGKWVSALDSAGSWDDSKEFDFYGHIMLMVALVMVLLVILVAFVMMILEEMVMMMMMVGWRRERGWSQYGEVGQPSSGVWRLEKRLQQGWIMQSLQVAQNIFKLTHTVISVNWVTRIIWVWRLHLKDCQKHDKCILCDTIAENLSTLII